MTDEAPPLPVPAPVPASSDGARVAGGGEVAARFEPVVAYAGAGLVAAVVATGLMVGGRVPGIAAPGPLVEYGLPVARVLLDASAVATIGLSLLARLLGYDAPDRTEPVMRTARRLAFVSAVAWVACALIATTLQAAEVNPGVPLTPGAVAAYVGAVAGGKGLMLSAGCALVCAFFGWLALRHGEKVPAELRIGIALFGLLPLPVTGHASDGVYHDYSMISMELHVAGAAVWTGGLLAVAVLVAARPALLELALPRFSRLASAAIFVVAATGLFNGLVELALTPGVTLPGGLLTTGYGVLVLVKVALVALLGGLGAHFRFRLLPAVARGGRAAVFGWASGEVAVMGLAYGVGFVLSRAPVV
ncbi:MAG TPA: CopD family protein [Streptosporangiaceae bacterium]|jgi:putative copper resistance protein D